MLLSEPSLPEASSLASISFNSIRYLDQKGSGKVVSDIASRDSSSYDLKRCYLSVCKGHWDTRECYAGDTRTTAMCQLEIWDWDVSNCPISLLSRRELQLIYRDKKIAFFGDSIIRNIYQAFNVLLAENYSEISDATLRHSDQSFDHFISNTTVKFFWAPFSGNITQKMNNVHSGEYEIILMGAAVWDALHIKSLDKYSTSLRKLERQLRRLIGSSYTVWMQPTTIVDGRLNTAEKQKFMTESTVDQYRLAYKNSPLAKQIEFTVNPAYVTATQEGSSADGVHYSVKVSQVLSQIISNAYVLKYPNALPLVSERDTVSSTSDPNHTMGHPLYGSLVLFFSVIMIYLMDSFFGVGVLSLAMFSKYIDWDAAYLPLLSKIGVVRLRQAVNPEIDIQVVSTDESSTVPLIDHR